MQSRTTEVFRKLLAAAPAAIQAKAESAYRFWAENPAHPSLRFKKVHDTLPIYVGVMDQGVMVWFWIGPHAEYEKLLGKL